MKFIIFGEHLNFRWELRGCVLAFKQFLIVIITHLLSKFAGLWSDFLLHEIMYLVSVVNINIGKVAIVEGTIEHN